MTAVVNTIRSDDGAKRCWWCGTDPIYIDYHDNEWGMPVVDDQRLFEKMCLEGFQAGLSWITVLKKRDAFRRHFKQFDFYKVAKLTEPAIKRMLDDPAIIRHRGKIESTINNAKQAIRMVEENGSLAKFFWQFEPAKHRVLRSRKEIQATTTESTALSRELKRQGWSFVGPTTCYALMQAMGMVNDHLKSCDAWQQIDDARSKLKRP